MTLTYEEQRRMMRNYSIMLRAALVCLVLALLATFLGGIRAVTHRDFVWLAYGLLFVVWSIGSAYLTVDSTTRVIDRDTPTTG